MFPLGPLPGGATTGYQIARSVRLRQSNSGYLSRTTVASPTNNKIFTLSVWVKRGIITDGSASENILGGNGTNGDTFGFQGATNTAGDTFGMRDSLNGTYNLVSTEVERDPAAWMNVVLAIDTTQATNTNRVKLYKNGVQITSFSTATYPAQNYVFDWNAGSKSVAIGQRLAAAAQFFDGYLADIFFIDGQQLTPSSFGQTDATTGVWSPIAYTGTYGTNGFHLDFSDNSAATAAAIGADRSGNGNNWTPSGISITAGTTNDSLVDTPTNYGVDTGAGGEVRGNYCTWSPLDKLSGATAATLSEGNLKASAAAVWTGSRATQGFSSGQWAFELVSTSGTSIQFGVCGADYTSTAGTVVEYLPSGNKIVNAASSAYGASWIAGDVIRCELDLVNNTVQFFKNGTAQGTISITAGLTWYPVIEVNSTTVVANFGQRQWNNTPTAGFKALCTQNLPTPVIIKPNQNFDATLYTGSASTQSIVNAGAFQPDLVWIKDRSAGTNKLTDSVRGVTKGLISGSTAIESTDANGVTAFNSNGFSLGTGTRNYSDSNLDAYVAWQWKKGATPGFDIVTYTGTGVNRTVAHSLGAIPTFMVVRDKSAASNWAVYHSANGNTKYQHLNATIAATVDATVWNSTTPTSSVFSVGTNGWVNTNGDAIIAYLFTDVPGFSKFGSYTGNGSTDGPFVYCGFRPRFVLVKRTDTTGDWILIDAARDAVNLANHAVYPNTEATIEVADTTTNIDLLSNGFKLRAAGTANNVSSGTYIFAAFAENPFKYSRAR